MRAREAFTKRWNCENLMAVPFKYVMEDNDKIRILVNTVEEILVKESIYSPRGKEWSGRPWSEVAWETYQPGLKVLGTQESGSTIERRSPVMVRETKSEWESRSEVADGLNSARGEKKEWGLGAHLQQGIKSFESSDLDFVVGMVHSQKIN